MDNKQQEQLREEFFNKFATYSIAYSRGHEFRIKENDAKKVFNWFISKLQEQERLIEEAIEETDMIFKLIKEGYFDDRTEIRISDYQNRLKSKFIKNNHDTKD